MKMRQDIFDRRRSSNMGSAALELVLLTPVLVVLMLFIVFAGRAGEGMSELRHAADQGARAASQASRTRMHQAARTAVLVDLKTSGLSCVDPGIALGTTTTTLGTSVTVTVTCRVSDVGLSLLRVGSKTLRASSTEIIDRFRSET
jgi:Flp pilus assembly protein TadG